MAMILQGCLKNLIKDIIYSALSHISNLLFDKGTCDALTLSVIYTSKYGNTDLTVFLYNVAL